MTDFERILRLMEIMFLTSAALATVLSISDAVFHIPLADFLVKKLMDMALMCGSAIVGLLGGQHLERKKHRR